MSDNVKKFIEAVNNDSSLASQVKAAKNDADAIVKIAASKGFSFTSADLKAASELSDDDLDSVAGGWSIGCDGNTLNPTAGC